MKKLHNYQKRVFDLVLRTLLLKGKALMVMAPGLGKTVVSAFLTRIIHEHKNKILFLCNDNYILGQAHSEFRETFDPHKKLEFYDFFGAIKNIHKAKSADVIFGSFQSFNSKSRWYKKFERNHFDIIIVDEGHHSQARTFLEVIEYFNSSFSLCMTGTPDRSDKLDIRNLYGEEVVNISIEEGIAKGWLSKVEYHVLSDGLNKETLKDLFKEVVEEKRRISLNHLNRRLFVKKRDEEQIQLIQKYTKNWNKKCIIFCDNIHHVRSFASNLKRGTYVTFHSENSNSVNTYNLNSFKHGRVNIILSVDKFNEGIDVPNVEVIVFFRATESGTVYRQQLGRGLRKMEGKKKVIVLDFVGNIHRILLIQGMVKNIQHYNNTVKSDKSPLAVSGAHFSFDFTDELADIVEILRVARMGFYPTWQEASDAVIKLGIKKASEYSVRYKEDRQLPSSPEYVYEDFPSWPEFFGRKKPDFYPTWQEASMAARKLGIKKAFEYRIRHKEDKRLPFSLSWVYKDFPGFIVFFGGVVKDFYPTWQEASIATLKLGIKAKSEYRRRYKEDKYLSSHPESTYEDFPGFIVFFGGVVKDFYPTWQEAGIAAKKLGIETFSQYESLYKKDPRLPGNLGYVYKDFPSWPEFIGRKKPDFYPTWQEASMAARKLGIRNNKEYRRLFKLDSRLPSNLNQRYPDFLGWHEFFGRKKPDFYPTWQEAGKASRKLSIKDSVQYKVFYKKDSRLPGNVYGAYKDFPGWSKFLGKE